MSEPEDWRETATCLLMLPLAPFALIAYPFVVLGIAIASTVFGSRLALERLSPNTLLNGWIIVVGMVIAVGVALVFGSAR